MNGTLVPVDRLDFHITDEAWPFSINERDRITAYWTEALAKNPRLWNGDVLIGRQTAINDGVLSGTFAITDFASVIAWRGLQHEDGARHVFGMPGIITSDGALIFGVMADHTYNAGKIYPPGGSLDREDIRSNGEVDVLGSIVREMKEEIGLEAARATPLGLYALVLDRALTVISFLGFPMTAREIEDMAQQHFATEAEPELKGLWIVRGSGDIVPEMAAFARIMAEYFVANRQALTGLR